MPGGGLYKLRHIGRPDFVKPVFTRCQPHVRAFVAEPQAFDRLNIDIEAAPVDFRGYRLFKPGAALRSARHGNGVGAAIIDADGEERFARRIVGQGTQNGFHG